MHGSRGSFGGASVHSAAFMENISYFFIKSNSYNTQLQADVDPYRIHSRKNILRYQNNNRAII